MDVGWVVMISYLAGNVVLDAHFGEDFACRAGAASCDICEALTDAFFGASLGCEVKEALVLRRVNEHGDWLAVRCERDRLIWRFQHAEDFGGIVAEGGERLSVVDGFDHGGLVRL